MQGGPCKGAVAEGSPSLNILNNFLKIIVMWELLLLLINQSNNLIHVINQTLSFSMISLPAVIICSLYSFKSIHDFISSLIAKFC